MGKYRFMFVTILAVCLATGIGRVVMGLDATNQPPSAQRTPAPPAERVHCVVIHSPGPAWEVGVDFREQRGVMEHVLHYQKLHEAGKLALGGPFLEADAGGMMVPVAGVSYEEIKEFAASDPAVKNGLLLFDVKSWYVTMKP